MGYEIRAPTGSSHIPHPTSHIPIPNAQHPIPLLHAAGADLALGCHAFDQVPFQAPSVLEVDAPDRPLLLGRIDAARHGLDAPYLAAEVRSELGVSEIFDLDPVAGPEWRNARDLLRTVVGWLFAC